MEKPHIVIIGSGFGGVYTAKYLRSAVKKGLIDVTIVSKTNSFLFTPLLHEVATGSLGPSSVAESLREIFAGTGVSILQSNVQAIDAGRKEVHVGDLVLPYSHLVIATGSQANFYGIPGAREYALPLKTLTDAHRMREKIIDAFERAALVADDAKKKEILSFVVVGAGPTGVELVTELAEFCDSIERRYFRGTHYCCREHVSLALVSASAELLPMANEKIRVIALKKMQKMRIEVFLSAEVKEVKSGSLTLVSGSKVPAGLTLWTAGVTPTLPFASDIPFPVANHRLVADEFLCAQGSRDVFVIGDAAAAVSHADNVPVPMFAQAAIQQAKCVARNIISSIEGRAMEAFTYKPKGFLVSLGRWSAAGEILGGVFSGPFMWWIWRTVYLFKFGSWNKRLRIAFDWSIELFYPRDTTMLH